MSGPRETANIAYYVRDRIGTGTAFAAMLKNVGLRGMAEAVSAYQLRKAIDDAGHFVTVVSAIPSEFLPDAPFTRHWGAIAWNAREPALLGDMQSDMIADIMGWSRTGPEITALFAAAAQF